jgi:hypothetical protein
MSQAWFCRRPPTDAISSECYRGSTPGSDTNGPETFGPRLQFEPDEEAPLVGRAALHRRKEGRPQLLRPRLAGGQRIRRPDTGVSVRASGEAAYT